ncbi:hypothetical protein [Marinomonas flavescens]|uniref:hypothetical protein n=1 Tax=Marinomonas flavescens TaxID=2529379 RepID=UPI00105628B7|nr:hypothetical protein [Marinomonas flavescens]
MINHQSLTADERLLLLSLFLRYGVLKAFTCSIQQLVKDHPASKKSITAFFKKMQSMKILSVEKSPSPKYPNSYLLTTECSNFIKRDRVLASVAGEDAFRYLKVICGLYEPIVRRNEVKRLSNSNRFFLLILVLSSDPLGRVDSISVSGFSRLMGVSDDSIKLRIKTLISNGIIREYVQGGSYKNLFGKTKSSLVLDVMHPFLNGAFLNISRLRVEFINQLDLEYFGHSEMLRVFTNDLSSSHLQVEREVDISKVKDLIIKDRRTCDAIQSLITKYASQSLSSGIVLSREQILNGKITKCLLEEVMPKTQNDSSLAYLELCKLISIWSYRQACIYRALLQFVYRKDFQLQGALILKETCKNKKTSNGVITFSFEVIFLDDRSCYDHQLKVKQCIESGRLFPVDSLNRFAELDFRSFLAQVRYIYNHIEQ